MLNFQNEPPSDPRGNSLHLERTPANRPTQGIITTEKMVGTRTHFYHGRTIPCDSESCQPCNDGMPWRWHGYVGLYLFSTHRQVLFEFTARAAEPLTQYRQAYDTLRGCHMKASRVALASNSRVIIQTKPADLEKINLPDEPNLLEALSIIWNIARDNINVNGTLKDNPALAVHEDPLDKLDPITRRIRQTIDNAGNGRAKTA